MVIFYSYVTLPEGNMKLRRDQTLKYFLQFRLQVSIACPFTDILKKQKAQKHVKAPSKTNTHIYVCIYMYMYHRFTTFSKFMHSFQTRYALSAGTLVIIFNKNEASFASLVR